jgi:hypothetical protein
MTFENELREIIDNTSLTTEAKVTCIKRAAADFYLPRDAEMWDS